VGGVVINIYNLDENAGSNRLRKTGLPLISGIRKRVKNPFSSVKSAKKAEKGKRRLLQRGRLPHPRTMSKARDMPLQPSVFLRGRGKTKADSKPKKPQKNQNHRVTGKSPRIARKKKEGGTVSRAKGGQMGRGGEGVRSANRLALEKDCVDG